MRALILLAVCAAFTVVGIAAPQVGLYGYIWFALMRPDYMAFAARLGYPYSTMIALGVILGSWRSFIHIGRGWLTNPITLVLFALQLPILISCQIALIPGYSDTVYLNFVKMIGMTLFIPLLIVTVEDLKRVYVVTALSLGFWGFWHGTTGVLRGGLRIYGGIGGFMSENNTFACGLVMVLPFCWYGRQLVQDKRLRLVLLAFSLGSIVTVVLTFSRGAAVALAVLLLMVVMQSKHKIMTAVLIVFLALGPVIYLVKDQYLGRMSTIREYENDSSARQRLAMMDAAWNVFKTRPYFGVGLGERNFFAAARPFTGGIDQNLVVHNSYLQVLAHCGIFAFLLYLYLLLYTLWYVTRSSRALRKTNPALAPFPRAIQLSLIGFMVCSLTQPRATFDFTYMILMYAAAWYAIEKRLPKVQPAAAGRQVVMQRRTEGRNVLAPVYRP
jgi:probable O-glycosylation ligase (exosortase A-associated)